MLDHFLRKASHGINFIQFKAGEFLFPLLEPIFRVFESRNSETRKHFQQALKSLENKNYNVALVNLNMVLSLCSKHFLARVYRARLYVLEKRYRHAAEDYVIASQVNRFRFIHYRLYREYFASMNRDEDQVYSPTMKNFNQAYEILKLDKDGMASFSEADGQIYDLKNEDKLQSGYKNESRIERLTFSERERNRFSKLGPITRNEINKTNWEVLSRELSDRTKEP